MYETARLGVSWAAIAANGSVPAPSAPTPVLPPIAPACIVPGFIHAILLSLTYLSRHTSHNDQHLFPLTLRMHKKSSAKLGEMEPTTDEEEAARAAKFARQVVQR